MNQKLFLKKGLLLFCLLSISLAMSQTINTTYKTSINAKLAGLDKTKVPHNLLINQAMEFAELTDYNGAITTTNWATRGKFTSIYNTLLMSRVNASVTGLVSPTIFKTNWDNLRAENKIVLSGLYYKYSKFKPDAYPNFLVNNNGVVTDKYVGGVWQNPYIDQQVFAVSAPILVYKSLSLQVSLPALLWYTNQANSIQSIAIDFGNGAGYQTMTFGQDRIINYSASGTFEWKYKLTLTNAQILYSHSKLKIDIPVLLSPPTGDKPNLAATAAIINPPAPSCSNIAIVPFTGTRQYLGSANSATLQIDYAQNDCIIRNPLIVVEGFDSGLLGIENPFGEVSYIQFRNSTLESLNLYFEVINRDIIYINYNNGRDDLKRNAYLVEDIVKWVNTKKAQAGSTTPNIVIGQSMGGVIARYALRDMEVLGQAHQTSLFVSHDAPQQGANIPLGVQYFARHLADQFIDTPVGDFQISVAQGSSISIEDIQGLLNAQGTKQLLSNYINSGFAKDNSVFDAFQAELRGMGYPNQTRNIALSNGNHCAVPQDLQPSSTIFSLNGGASTTALGTILTTYLQPLTNIAFGYLAYEFNEPGLLLGLLPGSSNFAMSFNANALPTAGTNAQIYNGGISYTKVLFDFFGWRPQITVSLTDRSYNNPVQLSYDYYPGGKYQLPFNFESTSVNNAFLNAGITAYLAPSFNFIPVPSGLDIGSGTTPLNNADYLRKYNSATPPTGNTASPFANFTTSFPNTANINENHISFNTRNGNWLATELDNSTTNNQVFDCSFICADTQILGSNTLCNTATYTVPNNTNIYNWSITQGANLVTLSSNGSNTATLTLITGASGQVTLSLTFGDDFARCGNRTITKTIWVGGPSFSFQYNYFEQQPVKSDLCVVSDIPNYTLQQQGVTNIVFKNFNTNAVLQNSERICRRTSNPYCIEATVTNACGSTTQVYDCIDKLIQNNNFYTIYPNPSNNIISINLKDQNQKPISNTKIIATLYNMMGEKKSHVEIANNIASINVSNLPKGIYVLKINIDGNIESHQVAVE